MRISDSNAGYTMFRGNGKSTTHSIRQFPLHFPSLGHRMTSHFYWTLHIIQLFIMELPLYRCLLVGRHSSVGIATRYGLDGPGIESRRGRDFLHPSRPALGPTQPPIQGVPGLSPEVKRPGRSVDHPPTSSAEFNLLAPEFGI